MEPISMGARRIGAGEPVFVAAEIGINHNGDLDLARRTIDAAVEAGADAVKFQNYVTEDFISDRTLTHEYVSRGERIVESQYDMFKRCELTEEALDALKAHCDRRGIVFFSTPTNERGVAQLARLKAPLLKNGSDYLGHLPLVAAMAQTKIPTVLSTGMATIAEIDEAVRAFREHGGRDLMLLVCTSAYPTAPRDVHLRRIPAMAAAFGVPVGFSDHTDGIAAATAAVALGACFVEKHFTLDKDLPGPDHRFSCDARELAALVHSIRTVEQALGSSELGATAGEKSARSGYRLSCVAARELAAGTTIGGDDIAFRRPGTGMPPAFAEWLHGRRLRASVAKGHVLRAEDFE